MDKLLTPKDAAERLAVSPKSIRAWLRQGKLRGVRAGRLWRIRERDLEAFLDPVRHALETAPEDDEPWTEEDKKAVAEAEKAIVQGKTKPWEQVKRELGYEA
ncbi:MAG: helix-turn-helix domain-containing protein [Desulfotomaculales bacterium]